LARVIADGESWIYSYDSENKQQSSQLKSPKSLRLKKATQVKSKVKSMLIIFSDIEGIVHKELTLAGQRVNPLYHCEFTATALICACAKM
jgi:hypothetical protein